MSLLLDSNVLLWWLDDSSRLGAGARAQIVAAAGRTSVSTASIWEIGIKQATGRLRLSSGLIPAVRNQGFELIDITPEDGEAAAELPLVHRDPFDRMLVAQAVHRGLTLMTSDRRLSEYDVAVLLVR